MAPLDFSQFGVLDEYEEFPTPDFASSGVLDVDKPAEVTPDFASFGVLDVDERAEVAPDFASFGVLDVDERPEVNNLAETNRADDSETGRIQTAVSQIARGAGDVVSGIPKAIAIQHAQQAQSALDVFDRFDQGEDVTSPMAVFKRNLVRSQAGLPAADTSSLDILEYARATTPEQKQAIRRRVVDSLDARNSALYKAGESVDQFVEEWTPVNKEFAKEFWVGKVTSGLGSMAAFSLLGLATRRAGFSPAAGVAGAGSALGSVQGFTDALQSGSSLTDAYESANLNGVIGLSEAIPVSRMLSRLDKTTGGGVKAVLSKAITEGTEEAIQEAFQSIMGNVIARDFVGYDPKRETFEGAGEGAGVGFTTGALMGFITSAVFGRRGNQSREMPPSPVETAEQSLESRRADAAARALLDPNRGLTDADNLSPIQNRLQSDGTDIVNKAMADFEASSETSSVLPDGAVPAEALIGETPSEDQAAFEAELSGLVDEDAIESLNEIKSRPVSPDVDLSLSDGVVPGNIPETVSSPTLDPGGLPSPARGDSTKMTVESDWNTGGGSGGFYIYRENRLRDIQDRWDTPLAAPDFSEFGVLDESIGKDEVFDDDTDTSVDFGAETALADTPESQDIDKALVLPDSPGLRRTGGRLQAPEFGFGPTAEQAAPADKEDPYGNALDRAKAYVLEKDGGKVSVFNLKNRFGITEKQAKALEGKLRSDGDLSLKGFAKKNRIKPRDAIDIAIGMGGIIPDANFKAMDANLRPKLLAGKEKGGVDINALRQEYERLGMLPEDSYDDDVYDLISDALAKNPNRATPIEDQYLVEAVADTYQDAETERYIVDAMDEARSFAKENFEIVSESKLREYAKTALDTGRPVLDIFEDAIEQDVQDHLETFDSEVDNADYGTIPFEEIKQTEDDSFDGEGGSGQSAEPGLQGESQAVPESLEGAGSESVVGDRVILPGSKDEGVIAGFEDNFGKPKFAFVAKDDGTRVRAPIDELQTIPNENALTPEQSEQAVTYLTQAETPGLLKFRKEQLEDRLSKGAIIQKALADGIPLSVPSNEGASQISDPSHIEIVGNDVRMTGRRGGALTDDIINNMVGQVSRARGQSLETMKDRAAQNTEQTDQGEQTLIEGVEPITTKDRIEVQQDKLLTGGNAPLPAGGLFDEDAKNQVDMFSTPPPESVAEQEPVEPIIWEPQLFKNASGKTFLNGGGPAFKSKDAVVKFAKRKGYSEVNPVEVGDGFWAFQLPANRGAKAGTSTLEKPAPTSWVIREKETGNAVLETSDQKKIDALNTDKFEAVPITEYLAGLSDTAPATKPSSSPATKPSNYGESNKLFTKDTADDARKKLKALLNPDTLNSGINPEVMVAGLQLAGFHVEAGARSFLDFSKAMIEDLGENSRPFLKMWYNSVRDYPGFINEGMTPAGEIDDAISSDTNLESDSENAKAQDGVGEANVPDEAGGNAGQPGRGTAEVDQVGSDTGPGSNLFDNDAAPVGTGSNTGVRPDQASTDAGAPVSRVSERGGTDSDLGQEIEQGRSEPTIVPSEPTPNVDSTVPKSIRDALPKLFTEQQEDVLFAENRFATANGNGVMFTNGTGTGKTWTGAGIAKRFVDAGKNNILILAPNNGIIDQWVNDGGINGLSLTQLGGTKESGSGPVITTYANMQGNYRLAQREWDLIIADESQNLMENQQGEEKIGLQNFRGITNHPRRLRHKARMMEVELLDDINAINATIESMEKKYGKKNLTSNKSGAIVYEEYNDLKKERSKFEAEMSKRIEARMPEVEKLPRSKVVFLSATPFGYDKTVDYGEGYLYDYGPEPLSGAYNAPNASQQFMIDHFGYRMRTGKLTKPEAEVESDLMEIEFHEWVRSEKALSGRVLTVDKDYDRKFHLIDDGIGNKIDELLEFLNSAEDGKYRTLGEMVTKRFDYLSRLRLLEAIKAHHAIPLIKKHQEMGRKVLVFHDFNVGGGINPFAFVDDMDITIGFGDDRMQMKELHAEFIQARPDALKMDFSEMKSPRETLGDNFPGAGFYSGIETSKYRSDVKRRFNLDENNRTDGDAPINLMIVQAEAGKAGLSAHDVTGEHPRVLINLGMPVRATTAIQQEGRIFRVGQASNASFRYMNTGTSWERQTFASKIAQRAGTAENLALGSQARALRQAFIDAFLDSDTYAPSESDGQGGKALDRRAQDDFTPFDRAKSFYFAQQKLKGKRDQRAGIDYFPTPEPIGLKMVEFADIKIGDSVLEPSAGHGSISRFFPETADRTLVERERELSTKAELTSPGSRVINDTFENLHISNKYDAIVMNPPYGLGGKQAMEHLAKAAIHLRNGGRIVALIPVGPSANKRFDAFYESDAAKDLHSVASINMPSITFKRAGTSVMTRIVVMEKQTIKADAQQLQQSNRPYGERGLTGAETINELFDSIENVQFKSRLEPSVPEPKQPAQAQDADATTPAAVTSSDTFEIFDTKHTKTGAPVYALKIKGNLKREEYLEASTVAKVNGGKYSRFLRGFQFKNATGRQAFLNEMGADSAKLSLGRSVTSKFSGDMSSIESDLKDRLKKLGIADKVVVKMVADLKTEGRFTPGLIEVAVNSKDGNWVFNHEVIHALREIGVFRDGEWTALTKAAKADTARMDAMREQREGQGLTESQIVEEVIADMFADSIEGKIETKGFVKAAFKRTKDFFNAVVRALTQRGYSSMEDIFSAVESGEIGRRTGQIETDAQPKYSEGKPKDLETIEGRKSLLKRMISEGAPLDRAFRIPFSMFGGFTETGEFKPGVALHKNAGRILTEAKFSPKGSFSWLNGPLESARAGLVDRYGLTDEFVERDRRRGRDERAIMLQGAEILKSLKNQNLTIEESQILQSVLTGEAIPDERWKKISVPIRQAVDQLGQEAVSLGLLSPESYERNRGAYLHRVYMKHEASQDKLSKWVGNMMGKNRKKIVGNQFKGRGIFLDVEETRILRDMPGFFEGRSGKLVKGEKVIVLDLLEETGELLDDSKTKPRKPIRRVFWPAQTPIPDHLKDLQNRGEWEIRSTLGKKITLWRDFSKTEREQMGEILDARYTIGKTFMVMAHDLAVGRFYKDISENNDWTNRSIPTENWVDASEYSRRWADSTVDWVRVPDTDIPKTGGKKRWGALSGKYVRAEIWRDLNELEIMQNPNVWTKALTQWKLNKTARSPVVHMNNVMSNFVLMDLADIRARDFVAGMKAYIRETDDFKEASANGAFGSDMISQEIRKNVLQPLLKELQEEQQGARGAVEGRFGMMGKLADRIWSAGQMVDNKMIDLYRLEDEVFRMATYMRRRSLGDNSQNAAKIAREQFLDYDIRAPWVNAARRTVLPFLSYTYRAAPVIAKSLAEHPWKIAKYATIAYAVNALAYAMEPGDEEEERRSLREQESGLSWIGTPRMQRMPWRDDHGNPVFLDVRRWIPAGDIFDMGQGSASFAIPAPLQFGGPMMMGAELMLNRSAFTGRDITNEYTDTGIEKSEKVLGYLWKTWMPSAAWVPGSWYWDKIGRAAKGGQDSQGRVYSMKQAISSSIGVKLKPQDIKNNYARWGRDFQRIERDLKFERRRLERARHRRLISKSAYKAEVKNLQQKFEVLGKNIKSRMNP